MKTVLVIAIFAAAQLTICQGLQCYNCRYVEGDTNQEACRLEYAADDKFKVDCTQQLEINVEFHYCSKWVGLIEGKETIVRNCYSKPNYTDPNPVATQKELDPECNFGKDSRYYNGAEWENLNAGNLCLCETDVCNGASTVVVHGVVLTGTVFLALKFLLR